MPAAIGPTADWLLRNQPFQTTNPFGPAGISDMTRQGWFTGLQGLGAQYGPAQQFAQNMTGLQQLGQGAFLGGLGSGAFQLNPWMQQAAGMAGQGGQHPGFGLGMDQFMGATRQPWMGEAAQGFRGAGGDPLIGGGARAISGVDPDMSRAADLAGRTVAEYGGGWSGDLASDINRTGASFDPFNNPALGEAVSEANKRLARDFREGTMRQLNQSATGAGPGAYGGTRAGVAQGIAERGLADAQQRQTTDMLARGYEAGLGRYVQDRGQTLDATLRGLQQGSATGLRGAEILGDLTGQQGRLGLDVGRSLADIGLGRSGLGLEGARGLGDLGQGLGRLGISAGTGLGNIAAQQGGLGLRGAGMLGDLGLGALGQQNNMFRFGFGEMLPGMMQQAYNAQRQPGQVMGDMGRMMTGIGGAQQMQNQAVMDWMNSQAAQRQQWPWEQLGRYQAAVGPIVNQPGQQTTVTGSGPRMNPWQAGIGGAATGMGLWNQWQQMQNPGAGYPAGDAYMPAAQWPQSGGGGGPAITPGMMI